MANLHIEHRLFISVVVRLVNIPKEKVLPIAVVRVNLPEKLRTFLTVYLQWLARTLSSREIINSGAFFLLRPAQWQPG